MSEYAEFLTGKSARATNHGRDPGPVHRSLYPFQQAIVEWAIRKGRASIFADCGLGKTRMQLDWIAQMADAAGLIVAPLCVAEQTIAEAAEMDLHVTYCTEPQHLPGIWITNYERLHKFETDPASFYDAIVLDESSILKSVDGKTRTLLLREFTSIPYRLCCTATPAPNDIVELSNHAEFMGIMSRAEFLATWFVHDSSTAGHTGWRLKRHAEDKFWEWVATWALYLRHPSDLGFEDDGFRLPSLEIDGITVQSDYIPEGMLFAIGTPDGIHGRHEARRRTLDDRVVACRQLIDSRPGCWLVWCGLNDEGRKLASALGSEAVLIEGSDTAEERIERHQKWRDGAARVLISKPSIFGHGMNWQHCNQMAFLGLGDSYEQYYQAIRRCWRYGQTEPVSVWVVTSDSETGVVRNVKRKEREAGVLASRIVAHVRDAEIAAVSGTEREVVEYEPAVEMVRPVF